MVRPINGVYQEPVWSKRDGVLVVPTITPITDTTTVVQITTSTTVEPTRRRRVNLEELSDYRREDYPKADESEISAAKRRRFNNRRTDDDSLLQ